MGTPLHLLYRYWSEVGKGFEEPDSTSHHEFSGIHPREKIDRFYKLGPP